MIASTCGSLPAHCSGAVILPAIGVAPNSPSFAAEPSDRARAQTSCPRLTSSRTMGEPIEPVPPRMKTRTILLRIPESALYMPGYHDRYDAMSDTALQRAGV